MDTCVSPPELNDNQLLRFIDGESNSEVVAHLERCPFCRGKSRQLAELQKRLTVHLYRFSCPDSLELGDYVLGIVPGKQKSLITKHLGDCPHCQKEVKQLKDYLKDLRPSPKPSPVERAGERARVIVARLIGGFDPGEPLGRSYDGLKLQPAYASLRGGTPGVITLQADGALIILEVEIAAQGQLTLIGQVASDEQDQWTKAKVELYENGVLLATDTVNNMGAFRCAGLLPGTIEIKIIPGQGPIVLANIEIAA